MSNALRRWRQNRNHQTPSQRFQGFWREIGAETLGQRLLFMGVAGFTLITFVLAILSIGLPNPQSLVFADSDQSTEIMSRDGEELFELYKEKEQVKIAFEEMPQSVKDAVIALEDDDFYRHHGIDVAGITRAAYQTVFEGDLQGGSTITQQLAKNALLSPSRNIIRKMRELILTFQIEQNYTKDKILEMYLNEVPFGGNAYGIEAAAQQFFGKTATDLTLGESAMLAALPRAPTYYSPRGNNPDRLEARMNLALSRMQEEGMITEEELQEAQPSEVIAQVIPRQNQIRAPHFVMWVREQLVERYGEDMLRQGGLEVITSLDMDNQQIAEQAVAARVETNTERYDASNASLVSIDPNTGEVLAMVGSADYFNKEIEGSVNVALRERQPGSSIKPVIYSSAMELEDFTAATMLMDVVTNFGGQYAPINYDNRERGPVSVRQALANSLNIPAVKTLAEVGVEEAAEYARDMGLETLDDPDRYGLSMVLGGGEVRLLDLASAYGAFANQGNKVNPVSILEVRDSEGRIIDQFNARETEEVVDPQIAYIMSDILSDDAARALAFGSGGPLHIPGHQVAAKTGTTDELRDAWAMGYTSDIVTGVWAGNNDNSTTQGGGSTLAAPIWNRYMTQILQENPHGSFPRPDGVTSEVVDEVSGKLPTDATPSTKTELFPGFNVPEEEDDVHVVREVPIMAQDKLAPEDFPDELTMEKAFTVLHSRRPNNPIWENPVIEWAEANGYNNVPTEVYQGEAEIYGSDEVEIIEPDNGQRITGAFTIEADVDFSADRVEFYYDDDLIDTVTESPYSTTHTPPVMDGQAHRVEARAIDGSREESYTIYVYAGKEIDPSAGHIVQLQTPAEESFPINFQVNLTDEALNLDIEELRIEMDGDVVANIPYNGESSPNVQIASGSSGNHTAQAVVVTDDAIYYSPEINFVTN